MRPEFSADPVISCIFHDWGFSFHVWKRHAIFYIVNCEHLFINKRCGLFCFMLFHGCKPWLIDEFLLAENDVVGRPKKLFEDFSVDFRLFIIFVCGFLDCLRIWDVPCLFHFVLFLVQVHMAVILKVIPVNFVIGQLFSEAFGRRIVPLNVWNWVNDSIWASFELYPLKRHENILSLLFLFLAL